MGDGLRKAITGSASCKIRCHMHAAHPHVGNNAYAALISHYMSDRGCCNVQTASLKLLQTLSFKRAHTERSLLYTLPGGDPNIRLQMESLHAAASSAKGERFGETFQHIDS